MVREVLWEPSIVTDPASPLAAITEIDPVDAQSWCNFEVFAPSTTSNWKLDRCTLRREALPGLCPGDRGRSSWTAANPSAVRLELTLGSKRVRLKQFLYDWAPAAGGQPCLWSRPTTAHDVGGRLVWLGTDYLGKTGGYARIGRTSCELRVLNGAVAASDILDVYAALERSSRAGAERVRRATFATLSYWARHDVPLQEVPYGLWWFHRDPGERIQWSHDTRSAPEMAQSDLTRAAVEGTHLDAVGWSDEGTGELEVLFTDDDLEGEVRLVVQKPARALRTPPRLDKHPCTTTTSRLRELNVHVACVDDSYGPFEAVVGPYDGAWSALVLVSPRPGRSGDVVHELVRTAAEVLA